MECRLVLNSQTTNEITNSDLSGLLHQQLKYYKFRRMPSRGTKAIFYLFFRKEEETYAALRAAKALKHISLKRYRPSNPMNSELPFRPFPPKNLIDLCRYSFTKYVDKFDNTVTS